MPKARSGSTAKRRKPTTRASKGAAKRASKRAARFLHKPNCTTCRKAKSYLERRGVVLNFRDLAKDRLTPAELERLIGKRDHTEFLNPRNELYRRKKMKDKPPSRREAIRMMAAEPNLIRRPIVVAGGRVVVGFDSEGMAHLF